MTTKKAKVESKVAHTPGPWYAEGDMVSTMSGEESLNRIRERKTPFTVRRICLCEPSPYMQLAECEANARLIAAAPDLLAAAKRAVAKYQNSTCIVPACDCEACQLMAAIAKATL